MGKGSFPNKRILRNNLCLPACRILGYKRMALEIVPFSICDKKEVFPLDSLLMMIKTTPYKVPAGMIYMIYNNNSHVKNTDYYLDQDVYAAILITENDEVVIMSQDLTKIDMLEKIILSSPLRADIELLDRYRFENQVFQSFSKTKHLNFSAFIDGYI